MLDTDKLFNTDTDGELSLESILAEYADFDPDMAAERDTAERSKQIIYESLGETEFSGGLESAEPEAEATVEAYYDEPEPEPAPAPEKPRLSAAMRYTRALRRGFGRRHVEPEPEPEPEPESEYGPEPEYDADGDVKVYSPGGDFVPPEGDEDVKIYGLDDIIAEAERVSSRHMKAEPDFAEYEPDNDSDAFSGAEDVREYDIAPDEGESYASPGSEDAPRSSGAGARRPGLVLGMLAALTARFRSRPEPVGVTLEEAEEAVEPEDAVSPAKAAKYYSGSVASLRLRLRIAIVPTVILLWVSLGLPAFGALGTGLKVTSLTCLILQLAVLMLGLDVFTAGIMSLARGRAGANTLVAAANIAAALDAVTAYFIGTPGWGYPMCAAAALATVFALWGAELYGRALRFTVKARELSPDAVGVCAAEPGAGVDESGARTSASPYSAKSVLTKSESQFKSWTSRAEEPDAVEELSAGLVPVILAAAVLLSAAASAISGSWTYFVRILAAIVCCSAPLCAFIACALPYFLLAWRTFGAGAAVAGWPGMRDIGRSGAVVVTDSDLFPQDSVRISSIRILDGERPEDVIADAGSVVIASGSGLAGAFGELLERNGCALRRVEDFCCHEGGGLTALIAGEEVLCGGAGFMRLMGVLVPQKLADRSAVFVAINGELRGIFTIEYVPAPGVGKALTKLLHSRCKAVFAVRDFLVTPLMLNRKYRVNAESFDFPTFAERYAVTAGAAPSGAKPCAILGREGLGGIIEVAVSGRRCYLAGVLGAILSAAGSVAGMLMAFSLFAFGAGLTASGVILYMSLWLVPCLIAALFCAR